MTQQSTPRTPRSQLSTAAHMLEYQLRLERGRLHVTTCFSSMVLEVKS